MCFLFILPVISVSPKLLESLVCFTTSTVRFTKFATDHDIAQVLRAEDIDTYRNQFNKKKTTEPRSESDIEFKSQSAVDGDVEMQENGMSKSQRDTLDAMETAIRSDTATEEDVKNLWIQSMTSVYEATTKELASRKQYEDCIKRPYFHVKPLDGIQLQAWWKYVDYMLCCGNHRDIVVLFERCLVACALYSKFWMRYVQYMEGVDATEAKNILTRAIHVFCKKKSEIYLFAARFFERQGDLEACRHCLQHVTSTLAPCLLSGIVQHAAFEYRHCEPEKGNEVYEMKLKTELESQQSEIVGFLATQYAYVLVRRFGSTERARETLDQVLAQRPDLLSAWEGAIQIEELISDESSSSRIIELYNKCTMKTDNDKALNEDDRCIMIQRQLVFLDLRGTPEEYHQVECKYTDQFGLQSLAPSSKTKRAEGAQLDGTTKKQPQGDTPTSETADAKTLQGITSAAMTEYFSQNPTAQQYAQYYQYAAAAAAAGYGSFSGFGTSNSG